MAKSKKKKEENSSLPKPKTKISKPDSNDPEDNFDFGGLPKRDLKKNLGCG